MIDRVPTSPSYSNTAVDGTGRGTESRRSQNGARDGTGRGPEPLSPGKPGQKALSSLGELFEPRRVCSNRGEMMAKKGSRGRGDPSGALSLFKLARVSAGVVAGGVFAVILGLMPYQDTYDINARITHAVFTLFLLVIGVCVVQVVGGFFVGLMSGARKIGTSLIGLALTIAANLGAVIEMKGAIPGILGSTAPLVGKVHRLPTIAVGQIGVTKLTVVVVLEAVVIGVLTGVDNSLGKSSAPAIRASDESLRNRHAAAARAMTHPPVRGASLRQARG